MNTATQERTLSIVEQIQSAAADTEVRQWTKDTKGAAQGDLNMLRLPDGFDFSQCEKVNVTQLAPGSTQGSRHTVSLDDFEVYKPRNFGQIETVEIGGRKCYRWIGYILKSLVPNGKISHPEHAHHRVCGANIATYGQVDLQTMKRVDD